MGVKVTEQQRRKANAVKRENEHLRQRRQNMFPTCIGMFPDDCEGVTEHEIGKACPSCPYFSKVRYMAELKELTPEQMEQSPGIKAALKELGEEPQEYIDRVRNGKKKKTEEPQYECGKIVDIEPKKKRVRTDKTLEPKVIINYNNGVPVSASTHELFLKRAAKRSADPSKFSEVTDEKGNKIYLTEADTKYLEAVLKRLN